MKRYVGILVCVVLLTLAGLILAGAGPLVVVRGWLTGEDFFAGRPTSDWRCALCGDPGRRAEAIASLESGGQEAAGVLGAILRDQRRSTAEARWSSAELLGKVGAASPAAEAALLAALADPDPYVRGVAAAAIPKAGVSSQAAVPALTEFLRRERDPVSLRALSDYRAAAQPALPLLLDILSDPSLDTESRWNAARTIGKIGPAAVSAVPALVACLKDEAATVREHAAEALGDIGPPASEGVTGLAAVLNDPAPRVRRDAVRSLGQIGEPARTAVPQIKLLLNDKETMVQQAARNALGVLAPDELPAKPAAASKGGK
jgi:HEAT repeat protein